MIQIRKNVFETNSSSTHSLSLEPRPHKASELFVNDEDFVEVELAEFCTDIHLTQNDRLAWLIQIIANTEMDKHNPFWYYSGEDSFNKLAAELYSLESFKEVEQAVTDYTGANGVRLAHLTEGYIDHESDYPSLHAFLNQYDLSITDWIFGNNEMYFSFDG